MKDLTVKKYQQRYYECDPFYVIESKKNDTYAIYTKDSQAVFNVLFSISKIEMDKSLLDMHGCKVTFICKCNTINDAVCMIQMNELIEA